MPQLNPAPWLFVMITTWLTMVFLMTKLTNTPTHNTPTQENKPTYNQAPWPW